MNVIRLVCAMAIMLIAAGTFELQAKSYTITVKADQKTQDWNRFYEAGVATCHQYTLVNSYWNRNIINALKFGHDSCGFKYWRGHGILHDDVGLVKAATQTSLTLDWKNFDMVYDSGRATGMYPVCEISTTPLALAKNPGQTISANWNNHSPLASPPTKYGWGQWEALMDSIVRHVKERYGEEEIRTKWYFEVWNEPNWWYASFPEYLELYAHTAAALKRADPQLRVGGPACQGNMTFNKPNDHIAQLLNYCRTSNNPITGQSGIPIDFITWHVYSDNPLTVDGINGFLLNPNTAVSVHRMILNNLKTSQYSWFTGPSMNNETGPSSRVPVQRDMHQSASWLVRTLHLLNEGGTDYPPPAMFGYWSISDIYEEGMNNPNNVSFQQGNYGMLLRGIPEYPNSWDIPKPVFQAYRLMHKLGNHELAVTGAIANDPYKIDNGVGVIATASKEGTSNDSIQIMVYNHYAAETQNSTPTDDITLTVDNIPWSGRVKVQHLVLDTTRSNTYTAWMNMGRPARPSNQQWDQLREASNLAHYSPEATRELTGNSFSMDFSAHYFSVHLITLTNPDVVGKREPAVIPVKKTMNAHLDGTNLMLRIPFAGEYSVVLYTTTGRTLHRAAVTGLGMNRIPLSKLPVGTFVMECSGNGKSLVGQFVLTR